MNIFKLITGNIVKWWQFKVLPVLRIDNNPGAQNRILTAEPGDREEQITEQSYPDTGWELSDVSEGDSKVLTDAESVLERINREKEEERKKLFQKAQEEARLAAIMDANKVDVNAFIQEGKKARQETFAEQPENHEKAGDLDAMARAEEIIARLNKEAAEDEAKKMAEIEEAREKAKETFGV